ncbi:MAG: hypothetical protein EBX35_00275 [Planctomycetia bacterium]|nr:hypothetical protein [Planctomycetia bacterium]
MVKSVINRRVACGTAVSFMATVIATGCFGPTFSEHAEGFDPAPFGGVIDASLPAAERERREVLRRLLLGIVAGEDIALISRWLPGVEFRESQPRFFNGNIMLRRWAFAPAPRPGAIGVTLEFVPADDAVATRVEKREYAVTGRHGAWAIHRAGSDSAGP